MRQGHLSQLDIQCLVLKHSPQKFETYQDEIEYLITHKQRNNFIQLTIRGGWVGVGILILVWVIVRIIGPAAGWWVPADLH